MFLSRRLLLVEKARQAWIWSLTGAYAKFKTNYVMLRVIAPPRRRPGRKRRNKIIITTGYTGNNVKRESFRSCCKFVATPGRARPTLRAHPRIKAALFRSPLHADWERVASRRVTSRHIEGGVKHPGIKHVGRAMTLNLPQTLHDLNHYRHPSRFPFRAFPFEAPSTSISRFNRNVPHLRGIPPHLVVVPAATPSLAFLPIPSPTVLPSRHSFLAPFDDPLEIYCLSYSLPFPVLLPHTATMFTSSFLVQEASTSRPLPHPFLSREPSQFRTCQF